MIAFHDNLCFVIEFILECEIQGQDCVYYTGTCDWIIDPTSLTSNHRIC